jgi:hypothetical protein
MKNTIRVLKNRKTSPRRTQAEILEIRADNLRLKKEFALPEGDCHPSCLAIYSRGFKEGGGEGLICKIPLTEKEFCDLLEAQARPKFRGMKPEDIVAAAIREKLALNNHAENAVYELNSAIDQMNVLFVLLTDKLTDAVNHGPTVAQGTSVDRFTDGIRSLADATAARVNAAFSAIHSKTEVAS